MILKSKKHERKRGVEKRDDYAILRFYINGKKIQQEKIFKNKHILKVRNDLKKARNKDKKILNKKLQRIKNNQKKKKYKSTHKEKIRKIISKAIKGNGYVKNTRAYDILGCDFETFKTHIERQFTDGMNWDNHGLYGWHYDHILPVATAKSYEDIIRLNHYTNLRPLWASDNLLKSDKIIEHQLKMPI